jgi:5-methylcytosine-specific restriction endonuclease McrA
MARSRQFTNRVRMGRASRRRIRTGGPLALGRPAASLEQWQEIRAQVLARARWVCQACGARTRLDVHHVTKRAQGGSDFDLDRLIALCRDCHAQTDAPFRQGRLVITPLGDGRFHCEVKHGDSKWSVVQGGRAGKAGDEIWPSG